MSTCRGLKFVPDVLLNLMLNLIKWFHFCGKTIRTLSKIVNVNVVITSDLVSVKVNLLHWTIDKGRVPVLVMIM